MSVTLRNYELPAFGRALAVVTVFAILQLALVQNVLARGPVSVADLAETLTGAVVNISTSQTVSGQRTVPMPSLPEGSPFREFFEDFFNRQQQGKNNNNNPTRKVNSLGSGFVIDPSGIIVTNNHVIADADEIEVNFSDGSKLKAEVIGKDAKTDIALLKVKSDKPLTAVPMGDSNKIRVGDWVMAIGNPFGLGGTVTVGIVSARNRDINSGPYDDFIQTDAAINRGNSGGPLFNMEGQVIGINTAIISPTGGSIGIGFAIPAATAMSVIEQLREFGETRRGWLGVRIQTITDELAETLNLSSRRRALWSPTSRKAARLKRPVSRPVTWSSSSTARRCPRCATCRALWRRPWSARKSTWSSSARARKRPSRSNWAVWKTLKRARRRRRKPAARLRPRVSNQRSASSFRN